MPKESTGGPKSQFLSQQRVKILPSYLLTLGHVTGLNGFYLFRFKTPFLNLPVLYIPWEKTRKKQEILWLSFEMASWRWYWSQNSLNSLEVHRVKLSKQSAIYSPNYGVLQYIHSVKSRTLGCATVFSGKISNFFLSRQAESRRNRGRGWWIVPSQQFVSIFSC